MKGGIAIIDFGSQYTQLIARRIREQEVHSEILPPTTTTQQLEEQGFSGVILSGGPSSPKEVRYPIAEELLNLSLPTLGLCYGMQLLNDSAGGSVERLPTGEYGPQQVSLKTVSPLFSLMEEKQRVWMSHGCSIHNLATSFQVTANSEEGIISAIAHKTKPIYGLQFHPEVQHTENGTTMLQNFLSICKAPKNWTTTCATDEAVKAIQKQVGTGRIVSLVSGGVDSTAATLLCRKAVGNERVIPIHIDNGLMRKGESEQVVKLLQKEGLHELRLIKAEKQFLNALKGITAPEEKRQVIGNLFLEILEEEMEKLGVADKHTYICQGTLYTDLIESGMGCGQHAATIKSHHNVNAPLVIQKREEGRIVEPNRALFKDEIRRISESLGVPPHLAERHPFPGPGLAIRILGEVTKEKLEVLREADAIYLEEIQQAGLYNEIWQAFAVLTNAETVGVMGDQRTEGAVLALRAINSSDGMTAAVYPMDYKVLSKISTRLVNAIPQVNRVVYDVTSKPPATIEWE